MPSGAFSSIVTLSERQFVFVVEDTNSRRTAAIKPEKGFGGILGGRSDPDRALPSGRLGRTARGLIGSTELARTLSACVRS